MSSWAVIPIKMQCIKSVTKSTGCGAEGGKKQPALGFIRTFFPRTPIKELWDKIKQGGVGRIDGRTEAIADTLYLIFALSLLLILAFALQCHEMVVRGQLPACEEDLQALAALRLQCLMGDFSTHAPCPPLDELFPGHMLEARVLMSLSAPQALPPCLVAAQGCPTTQRFPTGLLAGTLWSHAATAAHKQKVEQDLRLRSRLKEEAAAVMGSILERWKGLAGYSCRDSMAAYLTIARQWSGFGCTLYEVDFYISSTGSFSQKLWLGVAATSVSLYRQGEAEALESFPYGQICSYGVSDSNTFKITAGDRDLLFETTKQHHHRHRHHHLPPRGPCEAQPQSSGPRASSAGNGTAAKTKRGLFSLPIRENKPLLSLPAEGAGLWRREGVQEWERTGEGKGFCFASEAKNPQKPVWLLMRCHTPPHPILSRNHLCYPTRQQTPFPPPNHHNHHHHHHHHHTPPNPPLFYNEKFSQSRQTTP
ncbi:hypothetical protein INR49_011093 [Caranx melampygus]|nr:hypothetical protein INR49_011093 [Caranx melampygus]